MLTPRPILYLTGILLAVARALLFSPLPAQDAKEPTPALPQKLRL